MGTPLLDRFGQVEFVNNGAGIKNPLACATKVEREVLSQLYGKFREFARRVAKHLPFLSLQRLYLHICRLRYAKWCCITRFLYRYYELS